jgi:Ni,Fe-hydrogenase maturation factor
MPGYVHYLLLIFLLIPVSSAGLEVKQLISEEVIIQYQPPLEKAAEDILEAYPEIRTAAEKKFGWKAGFIPTVVLIHQNEVFRKMTGNNLITAYAVPQKSLIVIDYSKMDRTPGDLQSTFEHELYHLLLHQYIGSPHLPKWLDEGFAQWASGGIADIINPGNKDILKQAVLSDTLLHLEDIESSFPSQSRGLILSYQQSRSFVEYIVHEYGKERFLAVLGSLMDGQPVEQAISENLSVALDILELNWRKHLVRKYSWMSYLADHIYWILFSLAAVITVLGFLRFIIRYKTYRDDDEEEEERPQ